MPAARKPKKAFIQFAVAGVVAIVLGIGAVIIGFSIIGNVTQMAEQAKKEADRKKAEAEAELERIRQQQKTPIVISYKSVQATADIVPGQPITREMVTLVESNQRPEPGTATTLGQVVGKMVKAPIISGETLELGKLLDSSGFISVQDGMRAITIQVDNIGGLNGALSPGVRVDILSTLATDDRKVTRTLLQNVQVISVGDNTSGVVAKDKSSNSGGGAVTLAVTPKQAEMLTLANDLGRFHLTLRSFNDRTSASVDGADINELLTDISAKNLKREIPDKPTPPSFDGFQNVNLTADGLSLPNPAAAVSVPKFTMQVYKGTGVETVDFQQ